MFRGVDDAFLDGFGAFDVIGVFLGPVAAEVLAVEGESGDVFEVFLETVPDFLQTVVEGAD